MTTSQRQKTMGTLFDPTAHSNEVRIYRRDGDRECHEGVDSTAIRTKTRTQTHVRVCWACMHSFVDFAVCDCFASRWGLKNWSLVKDSIPRNNTA